MARFVFAFVSATHCLFPSVLACGKIRPPREFCLLRGGLLRRFRQSLGHIGSHENFFQPVKNVIFLRVFVYGVSCARSQIVISVDLRSGNFWQDASRFHFAHCLFFLSGRRGAEFSTTSIPANAHLIALRQTGGVFKRVGVVFSWIFAPQDRAVNDPRGKFCIERTANRLADGTEALWRPFT